MVCLARSSPVSTIEAQAEAIIAIKPSNKIGAEQGARDITKVEVIFCAYLLLKSFHFFSFNIIANFDVFSPLAKSQRATIEHRIATINKLILEVTYSFINATISFIVDRNKKMGQQQKLER